MPISTNGTAHVNCLLETDPHVNDTSVLKCFVCCFPFVWHAVCTGIFSLFMCVSVFEFVSGVEIKHTA